MSDHTDGEWHFVHVTWDPDDGPDGTADIEIMHPESCTTRITLGMSTLDGGAWVERLCGFEYEAENVGQMESLGNPEPGWYAARHWREEYSTMNSAWSEISSGIEVIPFTPPWEEQS